MAELTKNILKLSKLLLIVYLAIFPLGQLLKLNLKGLEINLSDIVILPTLILILLRSIKKPSIYRYFVTFFLVCIFSLLTSLIFFPLNSVISGSFYLVRLISYSTFFVIVWNLINERIVKRNEILKSSMIISLAIAIFGWLQYLFFPDLTVLKYLGWDDHYLRLVSTFLDPSYTGLILVFGALIFLVEYLRKKSTPDLLGLAFLIITVLYTYSRSSYLAFITPAFYLIFKNKIRNYKKNLIYLIVSFVVVIFLFLPKNIGEGTNFLRTQSIKAKLSSYKESLVLIEKSPLLGFGFNNTCEARYKYFSSDVDSHGCGGIDSSLLFILVTTGVIGFITFINLLTKINEQLRSDYAGDVFKSVTIAIFIHSLFTNSMFYPFIMGYLMILLSAAIKNEVATKDNK